MTHHGVVHIEIPAKDPKAAGKFYSDLFGWKIDANDEFDYVMFEPSDGPGGGFNKIDGEHTKPGDVILYVNTDDLEASIAKAESLGATVAMGKTEVPGMGWFAHLIDPSGNKIAVWKSAREG